MRFTSGMGAPKAYHWMDKSLTAPIPSHQGQVKASRCLMAACAAHMGSMEGSQRKGTEGQAEGVQGG